MFQNTDEFGETLVPRDKMEEMKRRFVLPYKSPENKTTKDFVSVTSIIAVHIKYISVYC